MYFLFPTLLLSIHTLSVLALKNHSSTHAPFRLRVDPIKSGLGADWQGGTDIVSVANGTLWIGAIKYEHYAEPFIAQGSSEPATSLLFTSYHASPTGSQYIGIAPNLTQPLALSEPHSGGELPPGYSIIGFDFDVVGRLSFRGGYGFVGCVGAGVQGRLTMLQIWYRGSWMPRNGTAVCTTPLYLYKDTSCVISG